MSATEAFRSVAAGPKVQFILLHEVKDDEKDRFSRLLDWLQSQYQVVSYSDAVLALTNEQTKDSLACISFDDGLKNNLNAARIMTERGMSGCFFISPAIIGERSQQVIDDYCKDRMLFKNSLPFMDWDDLEWMIENGHEIGNHSNHHYYMMDLGDQQFDQEVSEANETLTNRLGEIKHFAWPYGRFFHFRRERVDRVIQLGHASCASGERGCHQISTETPYCIRRDSISISWPLRHIKTFLKRASRNPIAPDQTWSRN